jgi:hypothetical protein
MTKSNESFTFYSLNGSFRFTNKSNQVYQPTQGPPHQPISDEPSQTIVNTKGEHIALPAI